MLPVDEALAIGRAIAAQFGEDLDPRSAKIAAVMERLLVEVELARSEAEHYHTLLIEWGIPHKRRRLNKIIHGGFEAGWE